MLAAVHVRILALELVSCLLNDLCICVWISVLIISANPDNKETGYSNVLYNLSFCALLEQLSPRKCTLASDRLGMMRMSL